MRRLCTRFLFLLLAGGLVCGAYAQPEPQPLPLPSAPPRNLRFDHSGNHRFDQIRSIFQDQRGYLWIGADNGGLYRYDGYETTRFVHDPDDPLSMTNNAILAILEDRDRVLWIGTRGGLNRLDRLTETFTHYLHDPDDATSISSDTVNAFLEVGQGNFWVGTNQGLNRMDREAGTFTHYLPDSSLTWIGALLEDQSGTLWAGSWGLLRFDPQTGTFIRYLPYPEVSEPAQGAFNWVHAIHEDAQGRLWVGTWTGGVYLFDRETETFTNYRHDPSRPLPFVNDVVRHFVDDPAGGLWLSTQREGLVWLDPESGAMKAFQHDPLDPHGISGNNVIGLYADRQGVLWVGSFNGDLDRLDRASKPFEHIYARPGDPNSLARRQVGNPIHEGPDGMLWLTSGCTLQRLDRVNDEVRHFRPDPNDPYSLQGCPVASLVDASGTVWAGGPGVLSRMDPDRPGLFRHAWHDPEDPSSLPPGQIRSLYEDTQGRLWVGSWNFGLSRMDDREKGRFTRFPMGTGIGAVNSIYEDHEGLLWLGTFREGLFRFDPETGAFENYRPDAGDSASISTAMIFGICERLQEPDVLWVAAYGGGLNRLDERTGKFTHLTEQNSNLPDNGAQGVLCDEQGHVWVSSDMGLSRFNPDTETFKNFGLDDGLQGLEFVSWAYHKSPYTGEMFFGGANGLNAFFPGEIRDNLNPPQVNLSGLRLFNEPVKPGPGSPLEAILSETEALTLRHDQNDLTLEYIGLHYRHPEKNQYAYMLEGYDATWRDVGTRREATYTGLSPGDYTFRVKAANSDGVWNEEGASLRITILPPWWRTWWAYILYGLLFIGATGQAFRFQRRRLLRRAEIEQAQLRAEAAEMQAQAAESQVQAAKAQTQALEAENARKRNVELLSEIGKELTASLDIDAIFDKLYDHVSELMPTDSFGVGLYDKERHAIDYRLAIERGTRYAPYTRDTTNPDQFPVWCLEHREPVFINDVTQEYSRYLTTYEDPRRELSDGTLSDEPQSLMYLPLMVQDRVLGVITVQSYVSGAYIEEDLAVLQTLAAYTSVALDNASAYRQLGTTLDELQSTQAQLIQSEKLASLGQLTSGIAHELKNPLNFVNNFAEVNEELARELVEELAGNDDKRIVDVREVLEDLAHGLKTNAVQIAKHGRRADRIVQSMMDHARGGAGERYDVGVNKLVDEYVSLSYSGMKAQRPDLQVEIERDYDEAVGHVEMAPQELGRALLNLLNNAFEAVHERAQAVGGSYTPMVSVATQRGDGKVEIRVSDNGGGIPAEIKDKIFEPFFTTKPTGSGTGLGLSLSYDIVTQGHGGMLTVESQEGQGATFIITLPVNQTEAASSA